MRKDLGKKKREFFPVPDFLNLPSVGLDISDTSIRLIEFRKDDRGRIILSKFAKKELPEGVVVKGEIKKRDELIRILGYMKKRYNLSFAHLSVSERNAYLFTTKIPNSISDEDKVIRGNIEFQLEGNVPLPAAEVVFDYYINLGENDEREAVVTALPRRIVSSFVDVFEVVEIGLLSLEVEAQAIARSVVNRNESGTIMVLYFGGARSILSIVSDGVVRLALTIDVGSYHITKGIKDKLNTTFKKADSLKKETVFIKNSEKDKEVFGVFKNIVDSLKSEVVRYYDYWASYRKRNLISDGKIKKVIVCGEDAALEGFLEYFSDGLGLDIELADVWTNVFDFEEYVPSMHFVNSLSFPSAIGPGLKTIFKDLK